MSVGVYELSLGDLPFPEIDPVYGPFYLYGSDDTIRVGVMASIQMNVEEIVNVIEGKLLDGGTFRWDSINGDMLEEPGSRFPRAVRKTRYTFGVASLEDDTEVCLFMVIPGDAASASTAQMLAGAVGVPPLLRVALLVASMAREWPHTHAPGTITELVAYEYAMAEAEFGLLTDAGATISLLPSKQIERRAMIKAQSVINGKTPDAVLRGASVLDVARIFIRASELLWQPNLLAEAERRIASGKEDADDVISRVAPFASAAISLHRSDMGIPRFTPAELVNCKLPPFLVYTQVLELSRHGFYPDLPAVTGGRLPLGSYTVRFDAVQLLELLSRPTANLDAIVDSLLADAATGTYVPVGKFILDLPTDYPLCEMCIFRLTLDVDAAGMWCMTSGLDACFRWQPDHVFDARVLPPPFRPLIEVTLAALWRDLHCAGESVVPVADGQVENDAPPSMPSRGNGNGKNRKKRPRSSTLTLTLPRRSVGISGRRVWASNEERERIKRRVHGVAGHVRRLQEGWTVGREAIANARDFGIVLPTGCTFVRPHLRGADGEGEVEQPQVVIRARGLATVMAMLGRQI